MLQAVDTVLGSKDAEGHRTGVLATSSPDDLGMSSVGALVMAMGCVAPFDGGHGTFCWRAGDGVDDGGTVIVPPGKGGYWQRLATSDELHVDWFGAHGNGDTDDTAAICAAIAVACAGAYGKTVRFGAKRYVMSNPGDGMLVALRAQGDKPVIVSPVLKGAAGVPCGTQIWCRGPGDILEVLGRGSRIEGIAFYADPNNRPRDIITVHGTHVVLRDLYIATARRHGIIVDSGHHGGINPDGAPGSPTRGNSVIAPSGTTYFDSNHCHGDNIQVESCGDPTPIVLPPYTNADGSPRAPTEYEFIRDMTPQAEQGCGLYIWNFDAQGGYFRGVTGQECNVTIFDGSEVGNHFDACYSEGFFGFMDRTADGATWTFCGTEDANASTIASYSGCVVGGTMSARVKGPCTVLSGYGSRTAFARTMNGVTSRVNIPAQNQSAPFEFWQGNAPKALWSQGWQPTPQTPRAYQQNTWMWHPSIVAGASPVNPYRAPFGFTEVDHPRGGGKPFIADAMLNTEARWTYRSDVFALSAGSYTLYLNGGLTDAGRTYFAMHDHVFTPSADARVTVRAELAPALAADGSVDKAQTLAALCGSDVKIGPYAWLDRQPDGGQIAVRVDVSGPGTTRFALLWDLENFVPDGAASGF